MSEENLVEQASLYVLGVLTPEEVIVFESAMSRDAELRHLVDSLRNSRDAFAGSVPLVEPPPLLKQKIMARIDAERKVVAFPFQAGISKRLYNVMPWALAACLALLFGVSISYQKTLRNQNHEMVQQLSELNQMAISLRAESQGLKQAVETLQQTNRLENVRVGVLGSQLADAPKAVAVSLWDEKRQQGVFVAQNLKPLPADRDYQLWVIDPKYATPVSAGVFQVNEQGSAHVSFKANKPIESATKFAVTVEPKGGLPTPTLKNLVLIGG